MHTLHKDWIWLDTETEIVNTYARFYKDFEWDGTAAQLQISACDEYVVWVNGVFAGCGQYDDYPECKFYDTLNLTPFCRAGTNRLEVGVYYQGVGSLQCVKSVPRLWFSVLLQNREYDCARDTWARADANYRNGNMELITGQLGFTFHYNAAEIPGPWRPACVVPDPYHTRLLPRPVKKLQLQPPVPGVMVQQGVLCADPACAPDAPVAVRMYTDLLCPKPYCAVAALPHGYAPQNPYAATGPELPCANGCAFTPPADAQGIYCVIDLKCETAGYPCLEVEAPAGTVFEVAYGEHLDDGRVRSHVGGRNFAFSFTAAQGRQSFTNYYKRIAGRYLQLHVRGNRPFTLYNLSIKPAWYPVQLLPRPRAAAQPLAAKIYDTAVQTLRLCMHEHYEDCPWREQGLYAMDGRNQALAGFYAFGEYEFPAACWRMLGSSLRKDGLLEMTAPSRYHVTIPSFSLAWVIAGMELARRGGEKYLPQKQVLCAVLDAFVQRMKDGLVPIFNGRQYWNFYEWSDGLAGDLGVSEEEERYDAALNLFLYAALREAVQRFPEKRYLQAMQQLRARFHSAYWSDQKQAYRSVINKEHYSELIQALALWCGLVPPMLEKPLRAALADTANGWHKVTLSHYQYKLDALMMEPQVYYDTVQQDILRDWGKMLFAGATSFWETIDGADAFDKAGSLCHGWSAVPVYFWGKYGYIKQQDAK